MKGKLLELLDSYGVSYEVIEHGEVVTVDDVFRELGISHGEMVKAIVLKDKRTGDLMLAALPGDKRISRAKAAKAFGLSRSRVDLAPTSEVEKRLNVKIGAIPPFGLGIRTAFDESISAETVYCGLGEGSSSLRIRRVDLMLVVKPAVVTDLCR